MDCSPPGSSIHGIFPARILEWIVIFFFFPGDLPDPGMEHTPPSGLFTTEPPGKPGQERTPVTVALCSLGRVNFFVETAYLIESNSPLHLMQTDCGA